MGIFDFLSRKTVKNNKEAMEESDKVDFSVTKEGTDALFEGAKRLVITYQIASVSLFQRHKIGYAKAKRLIDQLEHAGVIGPYIGGKSREVLIPPESFEMLSQRILKNDDRDEGEIELIQKFEEYCQKNNIGLFSGNNVFTAKDEGGEVLHKIVIKEETTFGDFCLEWIGFLHGINLRVNLWVRKQIELLKFHRNEFQTLGADEKLDRLTNSRPLYLSGLKELTWVCIDRCSEKAFQGFLRENRDTVNWPLLIRHAKESCTENIVDEFHDKIPFFEISELICGFSDDFKIKFKDKIDWSKVKKSISMFVEENKELKATIDSCIEKARQCPFAEKRDYVVLARNAIYDATKRRYNQFERDGYMTHRLEDPILAQIYKDAMKETAKKLRAEAVEEEERKYKRRQREKEERMNEESCLVVEERRQNGWGNSFLARTGRAVIRSDHAIDAIGAFWGAKYLLNTLTKEQEEYQQREYEKALKGY